VRSDGHDNWIRASRRDTDFEKREKSREPCNQTGTATGAAAVALAEDEEDVAPSAAMVSTFFLCFLPGKCAWYTVSLANSLPQAWQNLRVVHSRAL
jgi:hypothetical protein